MFDRYVRERAQADPDAPAVLSPAGSATYAGFDADITRFARRFRQLKLPRDGAVAVQLATPYPRWVSLLALARLGIASTPPGDPAPAFCITDTPVDNRIPYFHLTQSEMASIRASPPDPPPHVEIDPAALGRILFSSGTTGRPKRVACSWQWLDTAIRDALAMHRDIAPIRAWAQPGIDLTLGFLLAPATWAAGGAVILGVEFRAIGQHLALRPNVMSLAPLQLRALLTLLPPYVLPMPELRIFVGGARLPRALARRAREKLTPNISVTYGATECGSVSHGPASLLDARPGAVGLVNPGVAVEIVDETGAPRPAGDTGLVRIGGPGVAAGYMDGEPAPQFRDGWFYPGDLGSLDEFGVLTIAGRVDEAMTIDGLTVTPDTIEDALLDCPEVEEAGVFALPEPDGTERPWAAVVAGDGFDEDAANAALRAALGLPPLRFIRVPGVPWTNAGKVDRARLREIAREMA